MARALRTDPAEDRFSREIGRTAQQKFPNEVNLTSDKYGGFQAGATTTRCYHKTFHNMAVRFYNTLTRELQLFVTVDPNGVRRYTCRPTVYDYAHIGKFRTLVFYNLLRGVLHLNGYKTGHVMNITDVDDKSVRNSVAQGKSLERLHRDLHRSLPRRLQIGAHLLKKNILLEDTKDGIRWKRK